MSSSTWLPLGIVGFGLYWFVATIVFRLLVRRAEAHQPYSDRYREPQRWNNGNDGWWLAVPLGAALWPALLLVVFPALFLLWVGVWLLVHISRTFYHWAGTILSLFGHGDEA